MGKYSFVLSNELYKEYYHFKKQNAFDKDIIIKLLKFRCGEFLTNTKQLQEIGVEKEVEKTTLISLHKAGFKNQSLEELVNKTDYKLILCTDKSNFPYVNINEDSVTVAVIGCYYRDASRNKAISHIKALCKNANQLYLYDTYLYGRNESIDGLKSILPDKNIEIIYHPDHLTSGDITHLFDVNPKWCFKSDNNIQSHHDRYIIVDDKVEIILSSGFHYLTAQSKELTYIVRPIVCNRLLRRMP